MTQITINKNEHKADLLLDTLEFKKHAQDGGDVIIFLLLTVLF